MRLLQSRQGRTNNGCKVLQTQGYSSIVNNYHKKAGGYHMERKLALDVMQVRLAFNASGPRTDASMLGNE
jgi:hypothetical protein